MTDIVFPSNVEFPADGLWVKNEEMCKETGLNIYTCTRSYTSYYGNSYVYRNGNYYHYSNPDNYSVDLESDYMELVKRWHISDTRWRFNMIGAEGLPATLPVYETTLTFDFDYRFDGYYWGNGNYYNSNNDITLYTFFIDGVMNVAVEASVTGESLLKFERYMPLEEYLNSLKYELETDNEKYYYTTY